MENGKQWEVKTHSKPIAHISEEKIENGTKKHNSSKRSGRKAIFFRNQTAWEDGGGWGWP